MCGGSKSAFDLADPIMRHYAKQTLHIGPAGHGQLTKMVNQICVSGIIQSLSEGLNFAIKAGLDTQAVIKAMQQGAAQSWQLDHRANSMLKDQYEQGFAVQWMCKDLDICLQQAKISQASLPTTALIHQFFEEVKAAGNGHLDTSSLLTRLTN